MFDSLHSTAGGDLPPIGSAENPLTANLFKPHDFGDLGRFKSLLDPQVGEVNKHIEWAPSLQAGMQQAADSGKPLVVVFEEDQCGWCKKFDQELAKPAAAQVGGDAIFVRVRPSVDPDGQALATSLGITAYPTVSIMDVAGTNVSERTRLSGFMSAADFAQHIQPVTTSLA